MNSAALFSVGRRLAVVSFLALCLSGCGSAVTKENYQKIKDGMSESEVNNILGSPTKSNDFLGNKISVWEDDKKAIMITFVNNKVAGHLFVDGEEFAKAMTNMQNGGQPNFNLFDNQKKQDTVKPVTDPIKNNNPNNNPWNMGNNPNKNPNNNPLQPKNQPVADPTKCTKANLDRVQNGMTLAEITAILGPPSTNTALGDVNFLDWKENGQFFPLVTIHMRGGKVTAKFPGMNLK
jgi:outer membrane protein assembly factor BamE (lipoprotein component of BamABCDE complex)